MEQDIQQLILQEIKKLSVQVNKISEKTDILEKKMDNLEKRIDGLEKKFDKLEKRIDELEKKFEEFAKTTNERLKELEATVSSLNKSMLLVETQYQRKIDVIYEVFPELTDKVNANEGRSLKNKFDIEAIKGVIEFESQEKKTV